jgi:RimJ/RimL family protein N-acetyltransferase
MTTRTILDPRRASLRPLLNENSVADALASYYALHHPPDRAEVVIHPREAQRADGFLVRARTGLDLFRPLVTFRAPSEAVAVSLFQDGLQLGRPVYLTVPEALAGWANKHLLVTDAALHRVYRFNPDQHEPMINVLAMMSTGPDGTPRCEIRSGGQVSAVAGVNWQSPRFTEVYVYTDPAVRGRGWGRSVVSAVATQIVKSGRLPLYVVAESNEASIRVAEAVGFEDTGLREYVGQAVLSQQ